jgi:riboflavin kinase/FMN adenylyltransferase
MTDSPPYPQGGVFALGNFDGVHRGHQAVVRAAVEKAQSMGVPAHVLTFEPHPRRLFRPQDPPFRLTPASIKERLLKKLGIVDVAVIPFTKELAQLSAENFVEKIILKRYGAQHIVAGFDFVFGHNRGGDMQRLREWLAAHNVGVTEVTPFRDAQGVVLSSSRTREALEAGDLTTAEYILGRRWSITGIIEHGDQRGRSIGVPTANIALGDYQRPKFGVYAVWARAAGTEKVLPGVANIGNRPTVDGKTEKLEVHLFDFNTNIYEQEWEVELVAFIRPEQQFDDMDMLKAQIVKDIEEAKIRVHV